MTRTITLVRHHAADFDTWKKDYDSTAPLQKQHGVRAYQVLRSDTDPNEVIVTHTFDSSEAAHKFMAAPEINAAMKRAGVNTDSLKTSYYAEVESEKLPVS